jgi:murein DD-endopeptidase MepM/ murein hydrolase activator NlpD
LIYAGTLISDGMGPGPIEEPVRAGDGAYLYNMAAAPWLFWLDYSASFLEANGMVKDGDTLASILGREGVDTAAVNTLDADVRGVFDFRKIRPGHRYTCHLRSGELERFRYDIDRNTYLIATRGAGGRFTVAVVDVPYLIRVEIVAGEINQSLYSTLLRLGERPELADLMAGLYEYDIDFNRDIRAGDEFAMLVEKRYLRGTCLSYGSVLATRFTNRGRVISLVKYTDPGGKTAYYHPDGRAAKKMFLRCPLPFMRVTSRFGRRRHPVLGFSARHTGIDFGAPHGTRVRATGSGIVVRSSTHPVKGRYVILNHPNGYRTHYYHLSRRAKGIRSGVRVAQGEVIGYVGKTGRVTGTHLHYGVQKRGRFINPLSLKSPSLDPVKQEFRSHFDSYVRGVMFLLSNRKLLSLPELLEQPLLNLTSRPLTTSAGGVSVE